TASWVRAGGRPLISMQAELLHLLERKAGPFLRRD
ncbi:hypothetical protein ACLBU3_32055, partial [Pseudomonas aeruginosa]